MNYWARRKFGSKKAYGKNLLNDLYSESIQFGANYRKPIINIVKELCPCMSQKEQKELADYIEFVRGSIEDYIYKGYYNKYKDNFEKLQKKSKQFIKKEYSWMNSHNIGHAISQGIYFAWRG